MADTPDPVDVEVGARIRIRRRLLSISQEELAHALNLTFQQIQKYECAGNRLSAQMVWKLACALEVEIGYFFADLQRPSAAARPFVAGWREGVAVGH